VAYVRGLADSELSLYILFPCPSEDGQASLKP
jgi:hypothetical protein